MQAVLESSVLVVKGVFLFWGEDNFLVSNHKHCSRPCQLIACSLSTAGLGELLSGCECKYKLVALEQCEIYSVNKANLQRLNSRVLNALLLLGNDLSERLHKRELETRETNRSMEKRQQQFLKEASVAQQVSQYRSKCSSNASRIEDEESYLDKMLLIQTARQRDVHLRFSHACAVYGSILSNARRTEPVAPKKTAHVVYAFFKPCRVG